MSALPRRLEPLKLWHWRALVLLAYGYSAAEIGRRLGVPLSNVNTLGRRVCDVVCRDDQRDGRAPLAIVRVWATLNVVALNERVRAHTTGDWRDVPDVVTEARLGVA